jgi:glycosyltransferase involved in cell wall biosynthesis
VVPAWGAYAGKLLSEALESLRAQDLPARIIVVDNASEPPIGDAAGAEVFRTPMRMTVGAARNFGLEQVRTPYVVFWDADDLMLPGTLRRLHDRIAADPAAVLVTAAVLEGDPPRPHHFPRPWTRPLARFPRAWALLHSVWSLFPTNGATMLRTEPARASGFADANSGEDWVLSVSLAFRGRILFEPEPGLLYRRHETSLLATQRSRSQLARNAAAVRERIRADAGIPRWARALMPVIAALQFAVLHLVSPAGRLVRALRSRVR